MKFHLYVSFNFGVGVKKLSGELSYSQQLKGKVDTYLDLISSIETDCPQGHYPLNIFQYILNKERFNQPHLQFIQLSNQMLHLFVADFAKTIY